MPRTLLGMIRMPHILVGMEIVPHILVGMEIVPRYGNCATHFSRYGNCATQFSRHGNYATHFSRHGNYATRFSISILSCDVREKFVPCPSKCHTNFVASFSLSTTSCDLWASQPKIEYAYHTHFHCKLILLIFDFLWKLWPIFEFSKCNQPKWNQTLTLILFCTGNFYLAHVLSIMENWYKSSQFLSAAVW